MASSASQKQGQTTTAASAPQRTATGSTSTNSNSNTGKGTTATNSNSNSGGGGEGSYIGYVVTVKPDAPKPHGFIGVRESEEPALFARLKASPNDAVSIRGYR